MARKEEAIGAIGALQRNIDTVTEAAFEHRGAVPQSADTTNVADILVKHRLAFRTDDFGTQLNSSVMRLLHHVTKSHRIRLSGGAIADLLECLKQDCENYRRACISASTDDQQTFESAIQEQVFELIDLLQTLTQQFAFRVHNEFASISTLELKIRENERSLTEISRLNALFADVNVNELREMAGNDPLLNRLLLRSLKQAMDECRQELVATSHRLREVLARLQRDLENKKLIALVDTLYRHYQRVPAYKPDITSWGVVPDPFNRISPLVMEGFPDLGSELHADVLEDLARGAVKKRQPLSNVDREEDPHVPIQITDNALIEDEPEPVYEAVECFFDALLQPQGRKSLTGLEGYEVLAPDVPLDTWLMALVSHYRAQQDALVDQIIMTWNETPVLGYSGNRWVQDLQFTRVG